MIRISDLNKSFGKSKVLDGLCLTVNDGSIYGLVGTNGAGKTTIIKHLAGVLKQDSGEITFDGKPVFENAAVKEKIGLIPDELWFPRPYSLADMAHHYASAYKAWNEERFIHLTKLFRLDPKKPLWSFSKGMKKQAMFSLVLATMPEYLILDEPIDGLDPIVRKLVWKQIVEDVNNRGMSVLVSSHNLRDLETICDHVGIIDRGHTVLEKDLESVRDGISKVQAAFTDENREKAEEACAELDVLHRERHGSIDLLVCRNSGDEVEKAFSEASPLILDILPLSLEEVFIYELGGEDYDINDIL